MVIPRLETYWVRHAMQQGPYLLLHLHFFINTHAIIFVLNTCFCVVDLRTLLFVFKTI